MVHGNAISRFVPSLDHPGVRIVSGGSCVEPDTPDRRTVDRPRMRRRRALDLVFRRERPGAAPCLSTAAREKNSASRAALQSADVILNLVPDRFANGDPANDEPPGFADRADRASDAAGRHGGDIQGIVEHLDYIAAWATRCCGRRRLTEKQPAALFVPRLCRHRPLQDRRALRQQRKLPADVALARRKGIGVIQDRCSTTSALRTGG
jgi:hypothetical protein